METKLKETSEIHLFRINMFLILNVKGAAEPFFPSHQKY